MRIGADAMGDLKDAINDAALEPDGGGQAPVGQPGGPGGEPPDGLFDTTFSQGGGDRDRLVQFLRDLQRLLDFITNNPQGIVPDQLHGYLSPAWERVQPRFEPAITRLQEVSEFELEAAGLTGPELAMKLGGIEWSYRRLKGVFRRVPRLIPAAVSTVLGLCNVVADSIPVIGALLHPIGEYKSFVEESAGAIDFVVDI
jgi:hypothetical protein